jgi:uroporphyrin-III C-methyltransferase
MNVLAKTGKVILAAAGPGDPELITIKAMRYLQKADVVLTDRLVSPELLTRYVSKEATIIYVGKQCRQGLSTPQENINQLMIHYATLGKLVVRLKGGDVSIFSNILSELETLVAFNIPYEIIPGVTAALGAASYAGIPLTARGYANSVRFLTCYTSDVVPENYWKELAETPDTLVFYMSAETLKIVASKLTGNCIHEDKLMAVIEQATTPFQKVHIYNLYTFQREVETPSFVSPSLVIIGTVVSLHESFKWIENSRNANIYFNSAATILQPEKTT